MVEPQGPGNAFMGKTFVCSVLAVLRTVIMGVLLLAAGASDLRAACTVTIMPSSRMHGYGTNTNSVNVSAAVDCSWGVINTNSWISILSPTNNTGPGMMTYTIAWNTAPEVRSGNVIIGGRTLMITQTGNPARLDLLSETNGTATLGLQGEATKMYVLQYSDDFIHWTPVSTNVAQSIVTNAAAGNAPLRLYRTIKLP